LPTEAVTLNYGTIEWNYTQQKRTDGSGGGSVNTKFDLTAGK
jgi:type VI secretion system secreted protein Hcp